MRTVEPAAWARQSGSQCSKQDDWQVCSPGLGKEGPRCGPSPRLRAAPRRLSRMGESRGKHARTHPPLRRVGARPHSPGHDALVPASPRCARGRNPYGPWVPARSFGSPWPRARTWQQKQQQQRRSRERRELRGANTARVGVHGGSARRPAAPRGRGGRAERSRTIRGRRGGGGDRLARSGAQRSRPARSRTRTRRAEPRLPHPQPRRGPARPRSVPEPLTRESCSWKEDPRAPGRCAERALPGSVVGAAHGQTAPRRANRSRS